jgi:hypothetical protein
VCVYQCRQLALQHIYIPLPLVVLAQHLVVVMMMVFDGDGGDDAGDDDGDVTSAIKSAHKEKVSWYS